MDRIDLNQPRFTQAQVLKLVPELSAKDLQNWVSRGVLEVENPSPGRQGKRLYTGAAIVALIFMARITSLGIGPKAAFSMAGKVMDHAEHIHEVYPTNEENGRLVWTIAGGLPELYHRGYIFKFKGKHIIDIRKEELGIARTLLPNVYITVEIDFLVLGAFNRLYAFLAGVTLQEEATEGEELEDLLRFRKEIGAPGGEK